MRLLPINGLAADALVAFRTSPRWGKVNQPKWMAGAAEYAQAMLEVKDASDFYGIDRAERLLLEFLKLTCNWKHEDAEFIRKQLRQHLHNVRDQHAT